MPITPKQLEERKKWVGSSDAPALLGQDPWRNAEDVRLEKTGRLEPLPENEAMEIGTLLEHPVLEWSGPILGSMTKNQRRTLPDIRVASNIDAIVDETGEPVEAKTSGIRNRLVEVWGDDGTDRVPPRVLIQGHVHLMTIKNADIQVCHVPALLGGRGFCMFRIQRNNDLIEIIADRVQAFWKHVESDTPLEGAVPHLDVIQRAIRVPNKTLPIPPEIVAMWMEANEVAKQAVKQEELAKAAVLAAMKDAECGDAGESGMVTYLQQSRKSYTVKESTYRVLRHKKTKEITDG